MAVSLSAYENALFALGDILRSANYVLREIDPEAASECQDLLKRVAENRFNIVVAGRFNRGKSTLLNSILGSDYLPTGIVPLTSVITAVRFGNSQRAVLRYEHSALPHEIPLAELPGYITEEGNPGNRKRIRIAQIEVPSEILRHDYFFVDTPGLASTILENTRTTEGFLPEIDALVLVTSFESPLSQEEITYLQKAIQIGVRRSFLVVNKADLADSADRQRALDFVRRRCGELGLQDLPIFPVSARLGLAAKKSADSGALGQSGILQLEDQLISFVTHDKSSEFLVRLAERALQLLASFGQDPMIARLLARAREVSQPFLAPDFQPQQGFESMPRLSASVPDAPSPCEICAEVFQRVFRYFSQFQLDIIVDNDARMALVRSRGLCFFHTWQYEKLASSRGTAAGFFPLLQALSEHFEQVATSEVDPEQLKNQLMDWLAGYSRCPACQVRSEAETDALERIRSRVQIAPRGLRPPSICFPHLVRLIGGLERQPASAVLSRQAALLRRLAEEMQRFALRQEALRRDLITDEERLSTDFALQFLAGNKHVDPMWFASLIRSHDTENKIA